MIWELWFVATLFLLVLAVGGLNTGFRSVCDSALEKFQYATEQLPDERVTLYGDVIPVVESWKLETYQINVLFAVVQIVNAILGLVALLGDMIPIAYIIKLLAAIGNGYVIMVLITTMGRYTRIKQEIEILANMIIEKQANNNPQDDTK